MKIASEASTRTHAGSRRLVATALASALLALAALSASGNAAAQASPARPVTLLSPFAVGSSTDIMARLPVKGLNDRFETGHFDAGEVTQALAPAILAVTESAEFLKPLEANGFERLALSGADLGGFVEEERVKWERLIKRAGIEPQ